MGTVADFHQYVMRLLYRNGETGVEDLMGRLRSEIGLMWERGQIVSDKGQIHLPDDAVLKLSEYSYPAAKWMEENSDAE